MIKTRILIADEVDVLDPETGTYVPVEHDQALFPVAATVEPRLKKERVNETRYVRTFTREEVLDILRKEVLVEANRLSYESGRASIEIVSPALTDDVTVKVTMKEQAGHY